MDADDSGLRAQVEEGFRTIVPRGVMVRRNPSRRVSRILQMGGLQDVEGVIVQQEYGR